MRAASRDGILSSALATRQKGFSVVPGLDDAERNFIFDRLTTYFQQRHLFFFPAEC
jgi:hypothetical protein